MQSLSLRRCKGKTINNGVPDEIIEEILSRLPTKSLVRFRLISRQWLSLISNPYFIQSQLKHLLSNHDNRHQKLMIVSPYSSQFHSLDYESLNGKAVQLNIPVPAPHGVSVVGFCNGMFCISITDHIVTVDSARYRADDGDYDVSYCYRKGNKVGLQAIIWNPLLKSYHKVSKFTYSPRLWYSVLVGLGYESSADEYKMVKVLLKFKKVEVYSSKTNLWRGFPLGCLEVSLAFCQNNNLATFFKDSLYWLGYKMGLLTLIGFDLKDETFKFEEITITHPFLTTKLIVERGCLGIFASDCSELHFSEHLSLLMLKVDGCCNITSRSTLKILQPPDQLGRFVNPLCVMANGDVLITVRNISLPVTGKYVKDEMIIYNPQQMTVKRLVIHGAAEDLSEYYPYFETLVSPF